MRREAFSREEIKRVNEKNMNTCMKHTYTGYMLVRTFDGAFRAVFCFDMLAKAFSKEHTC